MCDDAGLQEHLGVPAGINFTSCSDVVDRILQPDVMKDVADLVPDLLAELPVLLYQGQQVLQHQSQRGFQFCLFPRGN